MGLHQIGTGINDPHSLEEQEKDIVIRSICDSLLPKLVPDDIPLLASLLSGVFPGAELGIIQHEMLKENIIAIAQERGFVSHSMWVDKVIQLYNIQQFHHGVMMVGPSGTGKSSGWSVLLEAMERTFVLRREFHVIDPKALVKDELYGFMNMLEWTDGIFHFSFASSC